MADRPTSAADFAVDLRQLIRDHEPPALNHRSPFLDAPTGIRVLIAEDEEPARIKLASDIRKWGHEVEVAADGEEAWQLFQKGDFPIVITDWMMPKLDGLQLVERVRSAVHTDYVYVIMLTSRASQTDVIAGLRAGADDFLTKPCNRDELDVRLRAGRRIAEMTRQLADSNRRMQASFEAAARMIRSRLPDRNYSGGRVHLAWDFRPSNELGGNLLRIFQPDARHLAFHLIDVEGRGIPSVLTAASVSDELRRLCADKKLALRPGAVIEQLHRQHADPKANLNIGLIHGLIDLQTRKLSYVNAGHQPPLLQQPGRPLQRQPQADPPLGVPPETPGLAEHSIKLGVGERLLFHSAGLATTLNPRNLPFGERRLEKTVDSLRTGDISRLVEALNLATEEWRGEAPQRDDFTTLVIEGL